MVSYIPRSLEGHKRRSESYSMEMERLVSSETIPWSSNMERFQRKESPSLSTVLFLLLILSSAFQFASAAQPIKTMVVLVMENRSFDHMLGWMMKSINPRINGVTGKECNPISTRTPRSRSICFTDDAEFVDPDPGHTYEATKDQVFGSDNFPSMSGFVEQSRRNSRHLSEVVMKGFKPESLPVYTSLVREFAVFDRWFSSTPGSTQPNRLFVYSATSHGSVDNDGKKLTMGYPQKTIFDSLYENRVNFGIYFHDTPNTLFLRNMRQLKYTSNFYHYMKYFKKHAREGKLPSVTLIEPRYFEVMGNAGNDDHPAHDVANGQKLVKEVYEALRAGPQWNETLLVITYDEHGGFYDHVPPPYTNVPNPDGNIGPDPDLFRFDRLGVRVPTIMVSPWIKKGIVISRPKGPTPNSEFEHSSIPATIKKMFNLPNFLNHRDAWAGTFEDVAGELTLPRTDCPEVLPEVTPLRKRGAKDDAPLSQFQSQLVHLAGALNGDHYLSGFPDEMTKKMTVKEAHEYVNGATLSFITASKEAMKMGANETTVVDMRSSLTTRLNVKHN